MTLPIPAEIAEFLAYDPDDGSLRWRVRMTSRAAAGDEAGILSRSTGYRSIGFRGTHYQAHRVAWFLMTGQQPDEIDHIDRDKANNRWSNLRNVPHHINMLNRVSCDHRVGKGVTRRGDRYRAAIWLDGGYKHLGIFDTIEEASAAHKDAFEEFHSGQMAALRSVIDGRRGSNEPNATKAGAE